MTDQTPGGSPEPRPHANPQGRDEIEDERWSASHQVRDWMWLALMIIGYCVWTLVVFALEPGLR